MKNYNLIKRIYLIFLSSLLLTTLTLPADKDPVDWNKAIKKGKIETIKKYIASHIDINSKDSDGNTPLYWAVFYDKIEIVKYLIEKGANINTANSNGFTPLLIASKNGYLEITKLLVKAGGNINCTDKDSCSAWMWAIAGGYNEVAKFLLNSGAVKPFDYAVLIYPSTLEVRENNQRKNSGSGCEFMILSQGRHELKVTYYEYKSNSRYSRELNSFNESVKMVIDLFKGDIKLIKYSIEKDKWRVWVENFK